MPTTTTQETQEGARIATVGRHGARTARVGRFSFPIWTGKIYQAERRADGVLTWQLVAKFGGTTSGNAVSMSFADGVRAMAENNGLEFYEHVTHNEICD